MKAPTLSQLKRRVTLCASDDVVEGTTLKLNKKGVRKVWARIVPAAKGSVWTGGGYTTQDNATHEVTLRAMADVDVTRTAWLYEERTMSLDQWYKVVEVAETDDGVFWRFKVRTHQRGETSPENKPGLDLARPSQGKW